MSSKSYALNHITVTFISHVAFDSLAKRAIVATQTLVVGGQTQVQVVDAVEATVNAVTTVVKTVTATETDATYICKYTLGCKCEWMWMWY